MDKSLLKTLSKAAGDTIIEKTLSGREEVPVTKREAMFKEELAAAKKSSFYKGMGVGLLGSLGLMVLVGLLSSVGSYLMSFMFLVLVVGGGWLGIKKLTEKRRAARAITSQEAVESLQDVVQDPVTEAKSTAEDLEAQLAELKGKARRK